LVERVLVLQRTGSKVPMTEGRDFWWHEECAKVPSYCTPEIMSSEDPLFILYVSWKHRTRGRSDGLSDRSCLHQTSGSTGKPKGVVHSTAGYLLGAIMTVKYVFDVHPEDRFACMADVGWITGHT
jgi:acetyl-CoA synthetase